MGAVAFRAGSAGLAEAGRIASPPIGGYSPTIDRSLVIGSRLFLLSSGGVTVAPLSTLQPEAFVAFPTVPLPVRPLAAAGCAGC